VFASGPAFGNVRCYHLVGSGVYAFEMAAGRVLSEAVAGSRGQGWVVGAFPVIQAVVDRVGKGMGVPAGAMFVVEFGLVGWVGFGGCRIQVDVGGQRSTFGGDGEARGKGLHDKSGVESHSFAAVNGVDGLVRGFECQCEMLFRRVRCSRDGVSLDLRFDICTACWSGLIVGCSLLIARWDLLIVGWSLLIVDWRRLIISWNLLIVDWDLVRSLSISRRRSRESRRVSCSHCGFLSSSCRKSFDDAC
jgi:hypothetical protein